MSEGNITARCSNCGSDEFIYPSTPPQPDDMIRCAGCEREIGRYEDVRETMLDFGRKEIEQLVRTTLSKRLTRTTFGDKTKVKWTER